MWYFMYLGRSTNNGNSANYRFESTICTNIATQLLCYILFFESYSPDLIAVEG